MIIALYEPKKVRKWHSFEVLCDTEKSSISIGRTKKLIVKPRKFSRIFDTFIIVCVCLWRRVGVGGVKEESGRGWCEGGEWVVEWLNRFWAKF